MGLTRRDGMATALTAVAALAVVAHTHDWFGLGAPRAAVAALLVVGMATCSTGAQVDGHWTVSMYALAALGVCALIVAVLGLVSAGDAYVTALFAVELVLWAAATARHALGARHSALPLAGS